MARRSFLGPVLAVAASAAMGLLLWWYMHPVYVLTLSYQRTGETIASFETRPGAQLVLRLTHSFEHVPWNEYYTVLPGGSIRLDRIEVGGFGAGIPAEMDVPTYVGEDGLVHMDNINSVFDEFRWITSTKNMKDLSLDGQQILQFSEIPHHSFVKCKIDLQRRLF